ncbi:MAG: coiled-coil domain-containing protein, partial [Acidimicrobiales bacterium]
MLDASGRAVRRRIIAMFVAAALAVSASAAVTPSAGASPGQEDGDDETAAGPERLFVADDLGVLAGSSGDVLGALDDLKAQVDDELARVDAADKAVDSAIAALAEADAAVQETQARIETLTARSDDVVVAAFVNPPLESAFDALAADSVADSSVKQAVLDMQADVDAGVLAELQEARAEMEAHQEAQRAELAKLQDVRATAETALGDLQTAMSQQALFVTQLRAVLAGDASFSPDPAFASQLAASKGELEAKLA